MLRRRILKTFPDWRDSAIATEGRHDDRYVLLTIPWVLATTDALNQLHEWAVELELVMFDPQIGLGLSPESWYEADEDEPVLPTAETMRLLATALGRMCRPHGYVRRGRSLDWRRSLGSRSGFDVGTDMLTGEVTVSTFALAQAFLDEDDQTQKGRTAGTAAWLGTELRALIPNDGPEHRDAIADLVERVRTVLLPELERATDEWVYEQLVTVVRGPRQDLFPSSQLLIWAASLGRAEDAEEATARLVTSEPLWWHEVCEVHRRYGGFQLPPKPEWLPPGRGAGSPYGPPTRP